MICILDSIIKRTVSCFVVVLAENVWEIKSFINALLVLNKNRFLSMLIKPCALYLRHGNISPFKQTFVKIFHWFFQVTFVTQTDTQTDSQTDRQD